MIPRSYPRASRPARLGWAIALLAVGLATGAPGRARAGEAPEEDQRDGEAAEDEDFADLGLGGEFDLLADQAVVELAARHQQDIGQSPSAVTVITREEIATSGATTIPDLLRLVPGMDVVLVSSFFTSISSRIHWTYENNVYLVLIDGREANVDLFGQAPWEVQPIALEDIERIEIIRGPGSALYGANAFAGVVSITTRPISDETTAAARLLAGEVGVLQTGARAAGRVGDWGFSLSAGLDRANVHTDPRRAAKRVWKARARVEWNIDAGQRLSLDVGAAHGAGAVPTGAGPVAGEFDGRVVRLAYESELIEAQLYWSHNPIHALLDVPLEFGGMQVAEFVPTDTDIHTLDAQLQLSLPRWWDWLLVIVGAAGRANGLFSDQLLDVERFPRTGEPGIAYWELRAGTFIHSEWTPAEWVSVTGGLRFDYNTESGHFLSPRLAAVFEPWRDQFLRLGAARAFRKPTFMETRFHPAIRAGASSPVSQDALDDFMLRAVGNAALDNEEMWSFEVGWLGRWLDGRLRVSVDAYYSLLRNMIELSPELIDHPLLPGVPDLDASSAMFQHAAPAVDILGLELAARYSPIDGVGLLASWTHRELVNSAGRSTDGTPKNLITLGGHFRCDWGLLGSLYLHSRSEFTDRAIDHPDGLLAGYLSRQQPNVFLVLARLGWRFAPVAGFEFETGARLFLPVSPFAAPHLRYYERGGGITPEGRIYGGDQLRRVFSLYLQGSY